jgi:putative Ig domain-containing protein
MHKLINATCRRTPGIAAGVVLAGGLAGGVLLTPGTAFAATTNTTTAITGTSQTQTSQGTTLDVRVSVTASGTSGASGASGPTGSVTVSDGSASCSATLAGAGAGGCSLSGLAAGSYTLTATYQGSSGFTGSGTSDTVTIGSGHANGGGNGGSAPAFTTDNPPLNATNGQSYSYTFRASGSSVTYSLGSGAPSWLQINPATGTVSGTAPNSSGSFSYWVIARNNWGARTVGPFTVHFGPSRHYGANVATYLSCSSSVYTNEQGKCTLYVTNKGGSSAQDVSAQIALPSQLRADNCGYYYGCRISGNTAQANLGALNRGQTKELTVTFTAKTGLSLWGWHHGHRFGVKVVGTASSYGGFSYYGNQSSSTAYVTVIPRGWWA